MASYQEGENAEQVSIDKFLPIKQVLLATTLAGIGALLATTATETALQPCRTAKHRGQEYTNELLETAHPRRVKECLRMNIDIFEKLCRKLRKYGGLRDTRRSTVEHQVHIFLYIVSTDSSNRTAQEHFQHSGDTISKYFHCVLEGILQLEHAYIQLPAQPDSVSKHMPIPLEITSNPKFYPYFQNCIGALDGSLIPATVPGQLASVYRCRKGFTAQNILVVCSFNFTFQYILAGWEGSAHDSRVLEDAKKKGFKVTEGKYYLGDAEYSCSSAIMVPYRGVRYHLKEQAQSNQV